MASIICTYPLFSSPFLFPLTFANDTEAYAIYANLFSSVVAAVGVENMVGAPNGANVFGVNIDLEDKFDFDDGRYDHSAQFNGILLGKAGAYWEEVYNLIV